MLVRIEKGRRQIGLRTVRREAAYMGLWIGNPSEYIQGAPTSSFKLDNKTEWMKKQLFLEVLMVNHSSHRFYETIKFCKYSGISMILFPLHTSYRMQPLDIGVFRTFKTALSVTFNDWLLSHYGEIITLRRLGESIYKAYIRSFT